MQVAGGNGALAAIVSGNGVQRLFTYNSGNLVSGLGGTFARADATTCATYIDSNGVLQTVAANVLRDNHTIGGVRCTLLEGARTNVFQHSQDFTNADWTLANINAAQNVTGPDGVVNSATTLTTPNGVGTSYAIQTRGAITAGQKVTVSFFFNSAGTGAFINVNDNGDAGSHTAWLNVSTKAWATQTGAVGGLVTQLGATNWYRTSITYTATNSYTCQARFGTTSADNSLAANNGQTLIIFGGMPEINAAFPSSYIATVGSAVTRAADVGPHFPTGFGEQASTWLAKYVDLGTQLTGTAGVFAIGDEKTKPSVWVAPSSGTVMKANFDNASAIVSSSGVTTSIAYGDTVTARVPFLAAGTVQLGIARNGGAESLDTVSAGQALGTGFGGSIILLNDFNTTDTSKIGFIGLQKLVGAAGNQSLATMLAL